MVSSTLAPAPRVPLLMPAYDAAAIVDDVLERLRRHRAAGEAIADSFCSGRPDDARQSVS